MPVTLTPHDTTLTLAECSTCLAGTLTTNTKAQTWATKHETKDCTK